MSDVIRTPSWQTSDVSTRPMRVTAVLEADFVTGSAKNVLDFVRAGAQPQTGISEINVSIVAYLRGGQAETAFVRAARAACIPIDIIHERWRFDASAARQLRRFIASREPDIVETHNVKSHFLVRLSGVARDRLWVAFHHGYATTDLKMRCYNEVNRWSLRAARHVVTPCAAFVKRLVRQGVRRECITVLHNSVGAAPPVSDDAIRPIRARAGHNVPLLVSIGRLSHEKGHVDLVRALAMLRAETDRFHLLIVGEGPERRRIEAARRQLRLTDCVTLVGLQHDVGPYYAAADIIVLPSHSEGSPYVLLEAMAAERPVVATRAGGVPEIVRDGETALLVSPRQPGALATALARLLSDPPLRVRLAQQAREVAATSHSLETYYRSRVRLYERLLAPEQA